MPPQQTEPAAQAEPPAQRQVAPEQLSPVGAQAWPQLPQLAASFCTAAQAPAQHCALASHDMAPQRWSVSVTVSLAPRPNLPASGAVWPIMSLGPTARATIDSGGAAPLTGGKRRKSNLSVKT